MFGLFLRGRFTNAIVKQSVRVIFSQNRKYMFCMFGLMFKVPFNSYGQVKTVSSPNHTFSRASLTKWLTSTQWPYLTTTLLKLAEGGE